jgi:predicted glycosyltransferase
MPRHEKAPPDIRSLVMRQKGRTTVIVSRGGGAFFPKIIAHAIQAQKILGPDYRFIIAAGPSTSKNEKRLFDALLARSDRTAIFLFDHIPHLGDLFEHADISVSMCGYNTSMQLLTSNIPSVIIPNPDNDQQARALWLKQYLKSSVLPYNKMTPRSLARAIRTVSSEPDPKIRMPKGWLNGLATTRKLILSDMAKTPSTR